MTPPAVALGEAVEPGVRGRRWRLPALGAEGIVLTGTTVVVLALVFYPLAMLLLRSLATSSRDATLTLKWYVLAYTDPALFGTIVNTFVAVAGSMLVAFVFGVAMAFLIARTDVPLAGKLEIVPVLPFLTPPFITAVGWVLLAAPRTGFLNGALRGLLGLEVPEGPLDIFTMAGIIWVMGLYLTPYVYLLTVGGFKGFDPGFEEASRTAGASAWTTLRRVTLPLITPALLSGLLLAFVMGLGQFSIPAALGTPGNIYVLSTIIWRNTASWPARPELAAALGNSLLVLALVGLYVQRRIQGERTFATITGKGFRPAKTELGRWRYPAAAFCFLYLAATVGLPYVALVYTSFARFWTANVTPDLFTLENFRYVLVQYPVTWTSIRNSLILSIGGATLCIALAAAISWIVHRTQVRGRQVLDYASMIPIGIPATVLALGLLAAWIQPPLVLYGTIWLLLVAYITIYLPFGVRATSASLQQVAGELEEASRVSGASWLRTMWRVTVPLIRPGLMAGWFLLFAMFMRELSASVLLYVPSTIVISVTLFDLWLDSNYPRLAAFAVLVVVLSVATLLVVRRLTRGRYAEEGIIQ